jgi:predicted metalloprotease with PDZ domain
MRPLLLLFALLNCSVLLHAQAPAYKIAYSFRYETAAKPTLFVTMRFRGNASGNTKLELPDSWASQKELYKAVTAIESLTPGVQVTSNDTPSQRILTHAPGADITIRYALQQDWSVVFNYPYNYRAILRSGWIHATGYALLVRPDWPTEARIQLSLDWTALPAGWAVANSYGASRSYTGHTTMHDLTNSLYIGGDFRLYERKLHGQTVYTAIRGNDWTFADTTLVNKAARIIGGERDFWKDHKEPYFLLSLVPFDEPGHYNGSALHHAFFMGMSPDSFASANIHSLLAHEYMHRWIGGQLVLKGKEEEQYWFSEGFTEYYTHKALKRMGEIGLPEYLAVINKTVSDYYLSPVRNASQKAAGDSFWLAQPYQRLPYTKGFTFAMYLDSLIQARSAGTRSLDNVLFALRDRHNGKDSASAADLLALVKQYAGVSVAAAHRAWIVEGGTIPAVALRDAGSYAMQVQQLGTFELGFDASALKKGAPVTGVIEGSAAWVAGLRNGQIIQSASIHYGDITKPVQVGVLHNGTPRTISYLPVHRQRTAVPQYTLSTAH